MSGKDFVNIFSVCKGCKNNFARMIKNANPEITRANPVSCAKAFQFFKVN